MAVDRLRITEISKTDSIICVKMSIKLSNNTEDIKNTIIEILFQNGVSDSPYVNSLFSYLSRYVG